jgi:hypothetical protein
MGGLFGPPDYLKCCCGSNCECPTPLTLEVELAKVEGVIVRKTTTITYGRYVDFLQPGISDTGVGWLGGVLDTDPVSGAESFITILLTCVREIDISDQTEYTEYRYFTGRTFASDPDYGQITSLRMTLKHAWRLDDDYFCCDPWIYDRWFGIEDTDSMVIMGDLALKNAPSFCSCALQTPVCCTYYPPNPICGFGDAETTFAAPMTMTASLRNLLDTTLFGMPPGYTGSLSLEYCEKLFSWGYRNRVYRRVWRGSICFSGSGNVYQHTYIFQAWPAKRTWVDLKWATADGCTGYNNFDDILGVGTVISESAGCDGIFQETDFGPPPGWLKVIVSE